MANNYDIWGGPCLPTDDDTVRVCLAPGQMFGNQNFTSSASFGQARAFAISARFSGPFWADNWPVS